MKHDVESDAESNDEEDVPKEEEEEGREYFVEHCDVDVVSGEPGVFGDKGDQLDPREKKCNCRKMALDIHTAALWDEKDPNQD